MPQLILVTEVYAGMRDKENPHGTRQLIYDPLSPELVLLLAPYYGAEPIMETPQVPAQAELGQQLIKGSKEGTKAA
jgi:hypothetical protein